MRPPYFAASTDVIDFGDVPVGEEEQRTVFLLNKGDRELELAQVLGDTLGGVFGVLLTQQSIEPTEDVVVRVVFSPLSVKDYETTIKFPNDSTNERLYSLRLVGKGTSADPCARKACDVPPPSQCLTSTKSRSFSVPGVCFQGQCEFEHYDEDCASGCNTSTGRCNGDPCTGVVCQTPPNSCFKATGTCVGGACQYPLNDGVTCTDGDACTTGDHCDQGICRGNALACNTPPENACINSGARRAWDAQGVCNPTTGACQYTPHDYVCQFGCTSTACQGNPCDSVNCDDGNPCTTDSCDPSNASNPCRHAPLSGNACTTGSSECPQGTCGSGTCYANAGVVCRTEVDLDLCMEADIAGTCSGNGECVPTSVPPEYQCPGCNGICIKCFIFQYCIAF